MEKLVVKSKNIVAWLLLGIATVVYFVIYCKGINNILNSDMSSELILGQILADEHRIITSSWCYSTEIRFLDSNLIYGFLFCFTDSFFAVRIISAFIFVAIYAGAFAYMCGKLQLKKFFPFLFTLLMLPYTEDYLYIYLVGFYYIFHMAIIWLSVGLIFDISGNAVCRYRKIKMLFLVLLAVFAGIAGLRLIIIFYLPLIIVAIINMYKTRDIAKYKSYILAFSGACIGYLINCLLARKYSFVQFGNLNFIKFDMTRVSEVISKILLCLGYREGRVLSLAFITNMACFFLLVGLVCVIYKILVTKRKKVEAVNKFFIDYVQLFCVALGILFCLFLFTDMPIEQRYFVQVMLMAIPCIGFAYEYLFDNKAIAIGLIGILICFWILNAVDAYKLFDNKTTIGKYEQIIEYAISNEYTSGYCDFWDGNVITEYSEGKIEMYTFNPDKGYLVESVDDLYQFLQKNSHLINPPSGKVFVLLSKGDTSHLVFSDVLKCMEPSFETEGYLFYGFDSYNDMKSVLE